MTPKKGRTKKNLSFIILIVQERQYVRVCVCVCVYASACCRVSINFARCCIDGMGW